MSVTVENTRRIRYRKGGGKGHNAAMADFRYAEVITSLRVAYDGGASRRDTLAKGPWKLAERAAFLDRLHASGSVRLLEVGAGTGQDSVYFRDNGIEVIATDLSPEMVDRCRAKGIDARVMDFLHLDFPDGSFDAVHAMNCLLHVPNADLPVVLETIRSALRPGGLFFLGVYGGEEFEGIHESDVHDPQRFFSIRTDAQLQEFGRAAGFDLVDFHVVEPDDESRFQSLTLRRPA
jgi:SAM-dependent methyltransferase